MNYPNQDDYETEEEYNQAIEWYWMEFDRQYDMWKDEQLESGISNGLFPIQNSLYPTGRMWVLKKESIDKILAKDTGKVILITPEFAENIGLNIQVDKIKGDTNV